MPHANGHNQRISILVVDDYEPWRRSVCSTLKAQPDLQVIGEASDGLEAIQKTQTLKPDLVLLDIGLPQLNGLEAEKQLCQLVPSARVLFVSQNSDAEIVHAALNNGARGYVLKVDAGELLSAITAVIRGERFVSSGILINLPLKRGRCAILAKFKFRRLRSLHCRFLGVGQHGPA